MNTRYRADDLRHLLEVSQASVLASADHFLGIDFEGIVSEGVSTLPAPPAVVWPQGLSAWWRHDAHEPDDGRADDLVVAFTTSGTTGHRSWPPTTTTPSSATPGPRPDPWPSPPATPVCWWCRCVERSG